MHRVIYVVLLTTLMTGCAGRVVCEWQTEDEQFQELIRQTIEEVTRNEKTQDE